MKVLKEDFYGRKTLEVAKDLLGKYIIREINGVMVGGKIVETEAYLGVTDKAAHVYGGKKTLRVQPLYEQEGTAYIYQIYGKYYCFNAITEEKGEPQGVLIRAIEPLIGLNFMSEKRFNKKYNELNRKEKLNLTSGPSKLCLALEIDKKLNNKLLWNNDLYILESSNDLFSKFEKEEDDCGKIVKSKRIGIEYAEEARDYLCRYYFELNPYVSKKDKVKIYDKE